MSKSVMGWPDSRANRGIPARRISSSMSPQGAKQRSHHTPSILFITPYRMRMPRFDMPISYVSGKQKATRVSTLLLSFMIALNSPPT